MKIETIVDRLNLEVAAGVAGLENEAGGGYAGDLLSDVLANSNAGDVWITMQSHQNTVAVAVASDLSAIVLVNNRRPDEQMAAKADKEQIPVLVTELATFEFSTRLQALLAGE